MIRKNDKYIFEHAFSIHRLSRTHKPAGYKYYNYNIYDLFIDVDINFIIKLYIHKLPRNKI